MHRHPRHTAFPARVAGFALLALLGAAPGFAETGITLSPRIAEMTPGLFCAPPDGDRRPAPDTLAGWVHVPDRPVDLVAEGQTAPALIGLGFGVRYTVTDAQGLPVRYTLTHPPMQPSGATTQSWDSAITEGFVETAFFQFDYDHELLPGAWTFSAEADGETLFSVGFIIRPAADLPALVGLCQGGPMLSFIQTPRAAAG